MEYNNSEQSNRKEQVMSPLTLELPQTLAQQVQAHGISQQGLSKICIQVIQLYMEESQPETSAESALPDGAEFARRLIAENKSLFDRLARL